MKSEEGQALVEFAITFMLVVLLLCGMVDFGRAYHAYLALDHAGREAARTASIGGSDNDVRTTAINTVRHLNISEGNITVEPLNRKRGDYVTVTINYQIDFITPIISNYLNLKSKTVMRME